MMNFSRQLLSILSIASYFLVVECSVSSYFRGAPSSRAASSATTLDDLMEPIVLNSAPSRLVLEDNTDTDTTSSNNVTTASTTTIQSSSERKLQQSGLSSAIFESQVNKTHVFPSFTLDPDCASSSSIQIAVSTLNIEGIDKAGLPVFSNTLRWLFFDLDLPENGIILSPRIVVDNASGRFIVAATITDKATFSNVLIAISKDANPQSGTSADWDITMINTFESVPSVGDIWSSEIGLAVDSTAVYVTGTMWHATSVYDPDTFVYSKLWLFNKASLFNLANVATTSTAPLVEGSSAFVSQRELLVASDTRENLGPYYPATIENSGAKEADSNFGTYLVAYDTDSGSTDEGLHIIRVSDALNTNTGATLTEFTVTLGDIDLDDGPLPAAAQPPTIDEDGYEDFYSGIETGARKIQDVAWFKETLYCVLTVQDVDGQTAVYYVELDAPSSQATPTSLSIESEYLMDGESIGTDVSTYFPSLSINVDGDVVVGFGASGPTGTLYAGMYAQQPGNPIAQPIQVGENSVESVDGLAYFGSTSGISNDPAEDGCYWVFNQYARDVTQPEPLHQYERGALATKWGKVCLI